MEMEAFLFPSSLYFFCRSEQSEQIRKKKRRRLMLHAEIHVSQL